LLETMLDFLNLEFHALHRVKEVGEG